MATDDNGQGYMPVADVDQALPEGTKNYLRVKIVNGTGGAVMPEAPLGGPHVAEGSSWSRLSESTGGSYFKWSTDTVTPPSAGFMSANNADVALITELYISIDTSLDVDVTYILKKLKAENAIFFTQEGDSTTYGGFTINGPVIDNLLYFTIPVAVGSIGLTPAPGSTVIVNFYPFTNKAYFLASSTTTVNVGTDPLNPSFLGSLTLIKANGFSLVDAATGAIRNDTGRVIDLASGSINFTPNKTGGGVTTVDLVSERANDISGPWVGNLESLRPIEIANNGESFQTKLSVGVDWQPGEIIRFRIYALSGGGINFESLSRGILGQTFISPSIAWMFEEQ